MPKNKSPPLLVAITVGTKISRSPPARVGTRRQDRGPVARASRGDDESLGGADARPPVQLQQCTALVGDVADVVPQAEGTAHVGVPKGMPELRDGLRTLVAHYRGGPLGDSEFARFERELQDWTNGTSTLFGRSKTNPKGGWP